ncbi:nucleoside hydrolase [Ameyamaea chiangmaiensis]|uniref:Nucleoside hydrolase n=1 Tax=Ameyamaea chiangmaiensis TaxID=442969 RepID=A0A850P8L3_9PROT|nr:nucleoside hydrolase [Ameyamaea chiangmaiensis]MBS4075563.1 nucleoside hydrolase [Ameyamaea chiangmaiensis]NVN40248.1 nucleoside hydrolase [Ameyamaea chiangmaiensis]
MVKKIIIDTDPGQDDAMTILLALASPEIALLGITTVAGNVSVDCTTRNALKTLELAQRPDVPVYRGAERPLVAPGVMAAHVHGATGFDGHDLPTPRLTPASGSAAEFLVRTLMEHDPGTVTVCAIGPLTNLGLALRLEPAIADRVERIVLMGGAFAEVGNITCAAEFNFFVDPHAAAMVCQSGIPLTVIPLDVTHQLHTTRARVARFAALGNRVGRVVADWLTFEKTFEAEKYGTDGGPLHDPNTVAWLLAPHLYRGREVALQVETQGALTQGASVVDWWGITDLPRNALFLRQVDGDGVYELLFERLARLP